MDGEASEGVERNNIEISVLRFAMSYRNRLINTNDDTRNKIWRMCAGGNADIALPPNRQAYKLPVRRPANPRRGDPPRARAAVRGHKRRNQRHKTRIDVRLRRSLRHISDHPRRDITQENTNADHDRPKPGETR